MDLHQIFRNIFGIPDLRPPNSSLEGQDTRDPVSSLPNGNDFRNPIWNSDGDDDDDDDFRTPARSFSFRVFTNPIEIHRFFEHQLGEIIKGFQNQMDFPSDSEGFSELEMPSDATLDPEAERGGGNLRDKCLKPEYNTKPHQNTPWFSRDKLSDIDLDERIKDGGLDSILKDRLQNPAIAQSPNHGFQTRVFGRSVISQTVHRPDGTVEHHRTVRDNQGNEETTVTRQVGDQCYTKTTQIDPSGVQKQTEKFVNIDENNLSTFEQEWKNRIASTGMTVPEKSMESPKPHNWFPFDKFF